MNTEPILSVAPAETCTMPEHGRADAKAACCRPQTVAPRSDELRVPERTPLGRLQFWRDAGTWRRAARNTTHCLLGCTLGDVAAMTLVPLVWPQVPMAILFAIAITAGIATSLALETAVLRWRERMTLAASLRIAWGMSLISMIAMELAMNLTDWLVMGGQRMPINHVGYWLAWLPALAVGFLAPLPYNYAKLRRHGTGCH